MSDNLRGYILDCGFLVFGDGMIRLDLVASVHRVENDDWSVVYLDGGSTEFSPMSNCQERNYRSMAEDCLPEDRSNGFAVAAEASTGCEAAPYTHDDLVKAMRRQVDEKLGRYRPDA